jgi:NAD-dependent dihydropyrimidine dehydrogenase PreA subunit
MAHVIGKKCLGEQYASCVAVCPVDCIHPGDYKGEKFMIIDPDTCIDCGLCLPECPVDAIHSTADVDPEYTQINKDLAAEFMKHPKVPGRGPTDPPLKPGNKLVR